MCNLTPCFQLQALEAFKTLENTIKENEMWAPFFFQKLTQWLVIILWNDEKTQTSYFKQMIVKKMF